MKSFITLLIALSSLSAFSGYAFAVENNSENRQVNTVSEPDDCD